MKKYLVLFGLLFVISCGDEGVTELSCPEPAACPACPACEQLECPACPACNVPDPIALDYEVDVDFYRDFRDGTKNYRVETRLLREPGAEPRIFLEFYKKSGSFWTRVYSGEMTRQR